MLWDIVSIIQGELPIDMNYICMFETPEHWHVLPVALYVSQSTILG